MPRSKAHFDGTYHRRIDIQIQAVLVFVMVVRRYLVAHLGVGLGVQDALPTRNGLRRLEDDEI